MIVKNLKDHLAYIERRKAELAEQGIVLPTDESMRNKGINRTQEKIELLKRINKRKDNIPEP